MSVRTLPFSIEHQPFVQTSRRSISCDRLADRLESYAPSLLASTHASTVENRAEDNGEQSQTNDNENTRNSFLVVKETNFETTSTTPT